MTLLQNKMFSVVLALLCLLAIQIFYVDGYCLRSSTSFTKRALKSRLWGILPGENDNENIPDVCKIDPKDVAFANLQAKARAKGIPDGFSMSDLQKLSEDATVMRMLQEPKMISMLQEAVDGNPEDVLKKYSKDPGKYIWLYPIVAKLMN